MPHTNHRKANALLWTAQILLALVFVFAGGMKLVLPLAMLKGPIALPGAFLRFIGVCELAGGLGMVLPGVLHIRTSLTPLAAAGLVIIMIGATTLTVVGLGAVQALLPLIVGVVACSVAYGRWRVVPLTDASRAGVLQPAR